MEQLVKLIDMIVNSLSETAKSDIVVGTPIEIDKLTLVPLSKVSVGFGGGGGEGHGNHKDSSKKDKKNSPTGGKGAGGGVGGGAKVSPIAVIVFDEDGVHVEPIKNKGGMFEQIFDKIPEWIDMAQEAHHKKCL
jgi:uncharacterized spore protein YtfJ